MIAGCRVCRITNDDIRREPFDYVVSPGGIAHHSSGYGDTHCGVDATGEKWWWPE